MYKLHSQIKIIARNAAGAGHFLSVVEQEIEVTFVLNTFQNILHIISGGLLGVFVGMSILSVFEFLFWLLQVPWRICSRANMTPKQEIVETQVTHGNSFKFDTAVRVQYITLF